MPPPCGYCRLSTCLQNACRESAAKGSLPYALITVSAQGRVQRAQDLGAAAELERVLTIETLISRKVVSNLPVPGG